MIELHQIAKITYIILDAVLDISIGRPTLGDVEIEEVAIEHGLDATGHHGNQVKEALRIVAVDPVEDVKGSVDAQGKQVVAGDGLCLSSLADHEQLRKNGHWFQVDGEGPQDLKILANSII